MAISSSLTPPSRGFALGVGLTLALALAATSLATLPGLKVVGTLCVAMLLGIAWRASAGLPAGSQGGIKFSARTLLRLGIVLMGARLNFAVIAAAGPKILLVDAAVVTTGLVGLFWLGRRFGLSRELSALMAVGTSICGASAVAAASSVTRADEESTSLAVALMGLLGTLGVFLYLGISPLVGLSPTALGIWSGSTLHEVAQVVAAAFTWGPASGDMGTMVKLTRVVMLAPAMLAVGYFYHRGAGEGGRLSYSWKEPPIPYFVLGFLLVGALNTFGLLGGAQAALTQTSIFLMALAMAGMGLNTDLAALKRTGWQAIAAGLIGFAGLSLLSFGLIKLLGLG